jgi:thymidylate synthase (FAD)
VPATIKKDFAREAYYVSTMTMIKQVYQKLIENGTSKEDAAMILPLGMTTKMIDKRDLRSLVDMSRQRMCNRAYLEYRQLFGEVIRQLRKYSEEWETIINMCFHPKCEEYGYCTELKS